MFSGASSNVLHLQGNVPQVRPDLHKALIVTRGHLVKAVRLWYLHVYIYIHLLVTFFLNQGIMQHNYYYFEEKKWLKSEIAKRGWKMKKSWWKFQVFLPSPPSLFSSAIHSRPLCSLWEYHPKGDFIFRTKLKRCLTLFDIWMHLTLKDHSQHEPDLWIHLLSCDIQPTRVVFRYI